MRSLFDEFKPMTSAEWKALIVRDLKGAPYESLIWQNENGFAVQPFYDHESLHQQYQPAFTHTEWQIGVEGNDITAEALNRKLLRQLNMGASSITVTIGNFDPAAVFNGIRLDAIRSVFFVNWENVRKIVAFLEGAYDLSSLQCCFFPESPKDFETWFTPVANKLLPHHNISVISADALPYHNLGCTAVYEVALIFSMLLARLDAAGDHVPTSSFAVRTGITADYFVQLAKLRAIRRLWNVIRKDLGLENELYIIAQTSLTNKTISESHNNLLRTTVEAMAAVAGGCNELVVLPFDALFPVDTALSQRLAINQQLIISAESHLDKMADVGCGSYYIENLTDSIAEKALEVLKGFEKQGGYAECERKGLFKTEIEGQAQRREKLVNSGEQVVVGVNQFRNKNDHTDYSNSDIDRLKQQGIRNAAVNYELHNFLNTNA
jgi:methylmalonyl-CoA mutase